MVSSPFPGGKSREARTVFEDQKMSHLGGNSFVQCGNGVFTPHVLVEHREEEYDPVGFDVIREMQSRHFWYRGRHKFLLYSLQRFVRSFEPDRRNALQAIDLGGGCGGWIAYLRARAPKLFPELALADSSLRALDYAQNVVGPHVKRYQIDLLNLPWKDRWDVVFLLDVLEHIPEDVDVLRQIHNVLRPGGYLFVTTPAFNSLRTYNDDLVHHVRRYNRRDFIRLAEASDLEMCWSRYFMFFLSPLLLLSRLKSPNMKSMTQEAIRAHLLRTHRVPAAPVNSMLSFIFGLETPLGAWLPFPWGTSILGVFRKNN
jgi:SAM-dependent methyltransferase